MATIDAWRIVSASDSLGEQAVMIAGAVIFGVLSAAICFKTFSYQESYMSDDNDSLVVERDSVATSMSLTAWVAIVAFVRYLCLYQGFGQVELSNKELFVWLNYIDYLLATPVMAAVLGLIVRARASTITQLVIFDLLMIVAGFMASISTVMSWRYVWLAVSVISFVNLFRILFRLVDIPTKMFPDSAQLSLVSVLYRRLLLITCISWFGYAVFFVFGPTTSIIRNTSFYTFALDLLSKGLWCSLVVYSRRFPASPLNTPMPPGAAFSSTQLMEMIQRLSANMNLQSTPQYGRISPTPSSSNSSECSDSPRHPLVSPLRYGQYHSNTPADGKSPRFVEAVQLAHKFPSRPTHLNPNIPLIAPPPPTTHLAPLFSDISTASFDLSHHAERVDIQVHTAPSAAVAEAPALIPVVQSVVQPVVQSAIQPIVQPSVQPVFQPVVKPIAAPAVILSPPSQSLPVRLFPEPPITTKSASPASLSFLDMTLPSPTPNIANAAANQSTPRPTNQIDTPATQYVPFPSVMFPSQIDPPESPIRQTPLVPYASPAPSVAAVVPFQPRPVPVVHVNLAESPPVRQAQLRTNFASNDFSAFESPPLLTVSSFSSLPGIQAALTPTHSSTKTSESSTPVPHASTPTNAASASSSVFKSALTPSALSNSTPSADTPIRKTPVMEFVANLQKSVQDKLPDHLSNLASSFNIFKNASTDSLSVELDDETDDIGTDIISTPRLQRTTSLNQSDSLTQLHVKISSRLQEHAQELAARGEAPPTLSRSNLSTIDHVLASTADFEPESESDSSHEHRGLLLNVLLRAHSNSSTPLESPRVTPR